MSTYLNSIMKHLGFDRPRYPRKPEEIYRARRLLQHAASHCLPDELIKPILFFADYDCIHFTAHSDNTDSVRSLGPATDREPYVETEPLKFIGSSPYSSIRHQHGEHGRIRKMELDMVGKDQGWASDQDAGSWSWFELCQRRSSRDELLPGVRWANNAVAVRDWQPHNLIHVCEDVASSQSDVWLLVSGLQDGDRVSIVPMAMFNGWKCNAKEATIDIEVEIWR